VIKVGAATEVEMKEKKARVEDALHATALQWKKALCQAVALLCCVHVQQLAQSKATMLTRKPVSNWF
jgi:hypothetical protein